jgi:hypothetical protein
MLSFALLAPLEGLAPKVTGVFQKLFDEVDDHTNNKSKDS